MKEQTAMPELPLCPFCGGKPILNHIEAHTHHLTFNGQPIMSDYPGSWTIECCDVGMIKDTREEVIAAWSRRAAPPAQAQPSRQVLNEFIEKFCLGKPELIATAQSAFYAFTQLAPNQEAAHAVGVEQEVPKIWYMRDNHTFRQLPENVDAALRDIAEELDAGYTSGMLCTKREGANPRHLHFSYTTPREEMLQRASMWLANEIAARAAKEKANG